MQKLIKETIKKYEDNLDAALDELYVFFQRSSKRDDYFDHIVIDQKLHEIGNIENKLKILNKYFEK